MSDFMLLIPFKVVQLCRICRPLDHAIKDFKKRGDHVTGSWILAGWLPDGESTNTDTIDRQDGVVTVLGVQVLCIDRGHGIDTWYVSPRITELAFQVSVHTPEYLYSRCSLG